jgi:hypothetical protein
VDEEASRIATTSLDGSCKLVDVRDAADVFDFGHERGKDASHFVSVLYDDYN